MSMARRLWRLGVGGREILSWTGVGAFGKASNGVVGIGWRYVCGAGDRLIQIRPVSLRPRIGAEFADLGLGGW